MYKKANIKLLLSIIGILLIILLVSTFWNSNKKGTLKTVLFNLDTANIDAITIVPKGETQEIKLVRINKKWLYDLGTQKVNCDQGLIADVIRNLSTIKPDRMVANDPSRWSQFEVTDAVATKVKVFKNGKVVSDFYIGKCNFSKNDNVEQQAPEMTAYVRLASENEVYAINGYQIMSFNRERSAYRNQGIVNLRVDQIKEVRFNYPADSSFVIKKDKNKWGIEGINSDPTITSEYISKIAYLSASCFVNPAIQGVLIATIQIETMADAKSVTLSVYKTSDNKLYMSSTANEGQYWGQGNQNFISSIVVSEKYFTKKTNKNPNK